VRVRLAVKVAIFLAAGLGGCAGLPDAAVRAPEPAKPVEVARLYVGRWYEIARTPMSITKDCVAGTTDYSRTRTGRILDTDACRRGSPEGKKKRFAGPVTFLTAGENTKMRVSYTVFVVFRVDRAYWILDHGKHYSWFILSDPSFKNLSVFTRAPCPSATEVARLTARAHSLGYDTSRLEYPAEFPPCQR